MKLARNLKFNPGLITVIPLVNVCFLVVIFFALSSRFVLQPGLAIHLPVSTYTLAPQEDAQINSVTAAPVAAIYFRDEKVTLGELIHLVYEEFLAQYGDSELASVATAAVVNDWLTTPKAELSEEAA